MVGGCCMLKSFLADRRQTRKNVVCFYPSWYLCCSVLSFSCTQHCNSGALSPCTVFPLTERKPPLRRQNPKPHGNRRRSVKSTPLHAVVATAAATVAATAAAAAAGVGPLP